MEAGKKTALRLFALLLAAAAAGILIYQSGITGRAKMSGQSFFLKGLEEISTASGLKAVFAHDKRLPYISFSLYFPRAGADYDFPDRSGLAFLTAELLAQGAGRLSSEEIQEQLNYYGTALGTYPQRQWTEISLSGLSWHAEELWDLFEKIISQPNMDAGELELLRANALKDRLHSLDDPDFAAWEAWRRRVFNGYGSAAEPLEGTSASLKNISMEDIRRFHNDRYNNGAPVLAVAGQFDKSLKRRALSFLEEGFKGPNAKKPAPLALNPEPAFVFLSKADQVQSQVIAGWPLFPFPSENPEELQAMNLANVILGGGELMETRLMKKLREEMGLTYGVYSSLSLGPAYGMFTASGATKASSTGAFLEAALKVLMEYREKGASPRELAMAKASLKSRYLKQTETPEGRLEKFIRYAHYLGAEPSFLENYIKTLESVSLEDINRAVKKIIRLKSPLKEAGGLQILIYGNPKVKPQLEAVQKKLGLPEVRETGFKEYFSEK